MDQPPSLPAAARLVASPGMKRRPGISPRGFTLVEVLITATVSTVLMAGVFAFVHTGMILSVKSLVLNSTGTTARLGLDKVESIIQKSYDVPRLVAPSGATMAAGSAGPAPGVRFYRYIGGPYVVTIPTNGLSGLTKTITVTRDTTAQIPSPAPQPNDAFIINTTILMGGEASQVRGYVSSKAGAIQTSTSGNRVKYIITLSEELAPGNASVIPYDADTTVTAFLLRPTAITVVPTAKGRELRHYEGFPNTSPLDLTSKHTVITKQVSLASATATPSASDPITDINGKPFSLVKLNARYFVETHLRIRDNRYNNYLANKQQDEAVTFFELSSLISTKCNPNE